MAKKRIVEIFSAGCSACEEAIKMVKKIACTSCDINVLDMNDPSVAEKAKKMGVFTVPTVVIDGEIAECCTNRGLNESTLRSAGIG